MSPVEQGTEPEEERLSDRLIDAAVQADFETGVREETVDEAKSSVIIRLGRMILGFTVTFLGILAIPLPGPGWLIVIAVAIGTLTRFFGAYVSFFLDGATGGIIVLLQASCFIIAFFFAPRHGRLATMRRT